uniref:Carbonyl reductase 1 n=1 Tax=Rhinolophus ferrumequinum TaxID=59479 RepID=A0A671DRX6_RHIFE
VLAQSTSRKGQTGNEGIRKLSGTFIPSLEGMEGRKGGRLFRLEVTALEPRTPFHITFNSPDLTTGTIFLYHHMEFYYIATPSPLKDNDPTPFHIQAEVTMKTNFFGTRDVCTELLPLMKPQGRVVNVSSNVSLRALKSCSPGVELQQKFRNEAISEEELVGFMEDTRNGIHQKEGWPNSAYGMRKIGITVLSRIHARNLREQRRGDKILLNACYPGWVRTDMARPKATKSPEEGAETPVYLALLSSDAEGPHGQFVMEKKVEQW